MLNEVHFSPGNLCKRAIIAQLDNAEDNIKICVFTISDDDITHAIIQAFRRGIDVIVITDDEKTTDKGSDVYQLYNEGIDVRTDQSENFMHHKFAVIDDQVLISGSFNWTRSASKYNQENLLVTDNKQLVTPYINQFKTLWSQMVDYSELKFN